MKPNFLSFFAALSFLIFATPCFAQEAFILKWATKQPLEMITIPTHPDEEYHYDIDWGDGQKDTSVTGDISHSYTTIGSYTTTITGTFPRIYFNSRFVANKLRSVLQWGTGKWTSMEGAFAGCDRMKIEAQDIPDLSRVLSMSQMFKGCSSLTGGVGDWDVSKVGSMNELFASAYSFDEDISSWDVSRVRNMSNMFQRAVSFNQALNNWDVSNVVRMTGMFNGAVSFNQALDNWDVSNVVSMNTMFLGASKFNQPIGSWDVSNVKSMNGMFNGATSFNQPIGDWNTERLVFMFGLFFDAKSFNQDISGWDVRNVTDMSIVFKGAENFNADISSWDVSGVRDMTLMFSEAKKFNQPIGSWDVSNVRVMNDMLSGAISFDQNLGGWQLNPTVSLIRLLENDSLSTPNYDSTLISWAAQDLNLLSFDGGKSKYCLAENARNQLIDEYKWTIVDGGKSCVINSSRDVEDLLALRIYPNPVHQMLYIDIDAPPGNVLLTIKNILGQIVKTQEYTSSNRLSVDVSNLPANNNYIIDVSSGTERHRQMFVRIE